jgi:hypothetical protein
MWHLPLAVLNQLLVWDDIANGRQPRWSNSGEGMVKDIDSMLAAALTATV